MGYAHDIHLDGEFDRTAFAAAVEDIRTLIRRSEIEVVGPWGRPDTMPILEDDHISFNGVNYNCICSPEAPEYHCPRRWCAVECTVRRDGSAQAFTADVRPDAPLSPFHEGLYWFDCKTHRLTYDPVVMMAMIALKYHLGDLVVMRSKGRWEREWGAYCRRPGGSWRQGRGHPNAIETYEHVFPARAPVRNILEETGADHNW